VSLVALAALALSVTGFVLARNTENDRAQSRFEREARNSIQRLMEELALGLETVQSVSALYGATDFVTRDAFGTFAKDVLSRRASIDSIHWMPRVAHADRDAFETAARATGFSDYSFKEVTADGSLVPAGERQEYFPVHYIEPLAGNETILGRDPGASAARGELDRARDSGMPVASGRLGVIGRGALSFFFVDPVYEDGMPMSTVDERRANLEGFVMGFFEVDDLVSASLTLQGLAEAGPSIVITIHDVTSPTDPQLLFNGQERGSEAGSRSFVGLVALAGRTWEVTASSAAVYSTTGAIFLPWLVLIFGLGITAFLAIYLLGLRRRTATAEGLERHRAAQLADANVHIASDLAAMQRSEARFRTLFDSSPVGISFVDADNRILEVNNAYAIMFNRDSAAVIGTSFGAPFPAEDGRWRRNIWAKLVSGELKMTKADRPVVDPTAHVDWVSVVAAGVRDDHGQFLYAIRVVEDISERKRAEQDLRDSREELALLNAANESILQSVGEGIIAFDSAGLVTSINPVGTQMLGAPAQDVLGKRGRGIVSLRKPDGPPYGDHEHLVSLVLETGVEQQVEGESLTRPDGSVVIVDRIITPLRTPDSGATVGVVMTVRDATERTRIERTKSEFLAMTSHELKTPLTAIHAAVGLIASAALGDLPEKAAKLLTTASANSDRLLKLINEIVELERLGMGAPMANVESCDARDLLEEVAAGIAALAAESGVNLRVDTEPISVEIDRSRIAQTLINLVGNAVKFSPAGSDVAVTCVGSGDEVEFAVSDSGPGVPPEFSREIFEPFKQIHLSDAQELGGSGLGLAISKGLVLQHGGRIWVEKNRKRGSVFKFVLPRLQPRPTVD
jgi:PAS domain S-box-containing protein